MANAQEKLSTDADSARQTQIEQLSTHSADRASLEQQIYCEVSKLAAIGLENDQFLEVCAQ